MITLQAFNQTFNWKFNLYWIFFYLFSIFNSWKFWISISHQFAT